MEPKANGRKASEPSSNGHGPDLPPGSTWLLYARDSGHERQAASCDQQLTVARQLLADAGARLAREPYVDRARKGGSTVGRAALDQLIADAAPGVADGVMFWSSARMAREVNDAQWIRSTLRRRGYTLFFISDNLPNIGPWTALLEVVQDVINAQRLEEISHEAKRGQAAVLAAGLVPSGRPPLGYAVERVVYRTDRDGHTRTAPRWVKDPALGGRIRQAWEMRRAGHSYPTINNRLELYSDYRMLSKFFRNPIYKGELHWGGQVLEHFVEPYVSEAEWEQVQALNAKFALVHPRTRGSQYLLRGLIFCGLCGNRMRGHASGTRSGRRWRRSYPYYGCVSRTVQRGQCRARPARAEPIEQAVLQAVEQTYLDGEALRRRYAAWEAALAQATEREREIAELEATLADLERRIGHLVDEVERGESGPQAGAGASLPSVRERLAQREAERADKRARLAFLRAHPAPRLLPPAGVRSGLATIRAALEQGDRPTAQLFLSKLVERVDVFPDAPPKITLKPPLSD